MKILGLISSPSDPASRARVLQYKEDFTSQGHSLIPRYFTPLRDANPAPWAYKLKKMTGVNEWRTADAFKSLARFPLLAEQYRYDIIWQNRLVLPHHSYFESKFIKPVVFDYDDAIWLNEGEKQVIQKMERTAMLFAGNEFLAEFGHRYNKNTKLVPSCIDTTKLFPLEKEKETFTIGWIGTKSNFQYLEMIKPALLNFLSKNDDARLIIVSSEQPPQFKFDDKRVIFKYWTADTENDLINTFSVGLMPLADTEWTKGKCGYKMLQYMACGIPVIVSPVGMNRQILAAGDIGFSALADDDWATALTDLKNNPVQARQKGINGRLIIEKDYSCIVWTPRILEYFKTVLN